MAFAGDNAMRAALTVLERATLAARTLGFDGSSGGLSSEKSEQLAALLYPLHNIPSLLIRWELCDESLLVSTLKVYDEKWSSSLADLYARVRSGGTGAGAASDLEKKADEAQYQAERLGRNLGRISAEPLPTETGPKPPSRRQPKSGHLSDQQAETKRQAYFKRRSAKRPKPEEPSS